MRVGVIGAGIGGLITAVGLQADGHDVVVYERRAEPGAVGAGLTLFANAFAALDAIDLGDAVRGVSSDAIGRLRSGQRQPSGRWLVSLSASEVPAVRSLHRADLRQLLVDRLDGDRLRLGSEVAAAEDGAPRLDVAGREERFDLVVAADRIRSDARRAWGLDRGLRYAGYTAWRGVTEPSGHLAEEAGETWGRGARFGIVPLPDERVYWFATLAAAPDTALGDEHGFLRGFFGSWHFPVAELLAATPAEVVLRHDIYDLAELPPSFTTGGGVLLGDAAHAMTPDLGQGAGQAIEDAATLVLLLRTIPGAGLESVLGHYDRVRRRRTRALAARAVRQRWRSTPARSPPPSATQRCGPRRRGSSPARRPASTAGPLRDSRNAQPAGGGTCPKARSGSAHGSSARSDARTVPAFATLTPTAARRAHAPAGAAPRRG